VAEELAKKYGNHRDIDGAAAAAATSRASRDLVSIHTTSTSKSSNSSSYCPPEPTKDVQCGNIYDSTSGQDVVVILGQNLICDENITQADGSFNAALTLVGEGTVLDCQGYTISQTTESSDAALDCPLGPSSSNETKTLRMKQECGFYYVRGVDLQNGASMVNCNVQKFWAGAVIEDGGEIKDSEFSLNVRGAQIQNFSPNTVSNIYNR